MSKAEKQEIENRKKAYRMECRRLEEELEEENRNTNFTNKSENVWTIYGWRRKEKSKICKLIF